jgi:formyltetrahydrofolate deformylase
MPPVHPAHLPADHACLIVHGSDKPGIVAAVSAMITRIGGNIVAFDQFSDDHRRRVLPAGGLPPGRLRCRPPGDRSRDHRDPRRVRARVVADRPVDPKRMAILASKQDHRLLDLLWRHRRGDLPVTIPMVISNHTTTAEDVRSFGVPFFHVPSVPGPDKSASEARF